MSLDSPSLDAEAIRRRDAVPLWVALVLALFLVVRLFDVGVAPFLARHDAHKTPASTAKDGGMDDEAMQDLLQSDIQAKSAFLSALGKPGTVVKPELQSLRDALKAAEQLQRESGNSPGAARRVILLRAVLNYEAPGKNAVPPLAVGKNGLDPLAAFSTALPADTPLTDRASYTGEARLWQTVFQGGPLSPHQTTAIAAQIRRLPHIRWWQYPALMALYSGQGDLSEANRYAGQARDAALPSILPFGLLGLVRLGLGLLGILMLIYFVVRAVQRREALTPAPESVQAPPLSGTGGAVPPPLDLWPTVPAPISFAQRRLGVGDLLGVFVVYLLAREVIGVLLTGFSGFGTPHLLQFHGLLTPFLPGIERRPEAERSLIGIILESAVYLLSAVPPVILLWSLAKRRGASLADEIGWTRRRLGANIVYGIGGFAVASALMLPVAWLAKWLFRYAPDPSNPVIPQLVNTSGFWGPFILVLLASVGAPIVEELLFRGVFYNAARMRLGVWPAIVLTGFVFGFVHPVGIAEMLAIGTLGGVFAWMAETRKSLAPSMFAHFLQNFTTTLLLLSVLSG